MGKSEFHATLYHERLLNIHKVWGLYIIKLFSKTDFTGHTSGSQDSPEGHSK